MSAMKKVLLLDNRPDRRARWKGVIERIGTWVIDSRSEIDRADYETSGFDVVVVHAGNKESGPIEEGWNSSNMRVLIFSGGFSQPVAVSDGVTYASERFLDEGKNLIRTLQRLETE